MQRKNAGFALPLALGVTAVAGIVMVALSTQSGRELLSLKAFRLGANRTYLEEVALSFLQNQNIVRSLIVTGDAVAINCWAGLEEAGCINNRSGEIQLTNPAVPSTQARLGFSSSGDLCDANSPACEYRAKVIFTPECEGGTAACRMAKSGKINVTLTPKQMKGKKEIERSFSFSDLYHPLLKAWKYHTTHYGFQFLYDMSKSANQAFYSSVVINPGDNLYNCTTGAIDGLGCVAGVSWLRGRIPGFGTGGAPLHYTQAPQGQEWPSVCSVSSNDCPIDVYVKTTIHCPGDAAQCEFAERVDFQEFLLVDYNTATHRPKKRIWNFETPVGQKVDSLSSLTGASFSFNVPNPYQETTITVVTARGDAGYTNCGEIKTGAAFEHLSCNKDGDRQFKRSIRAKAYACNRIDIKIYSQNSGVVANTFTGAALNHLQVLYSGPSGLQFGFEDQPDHKADWDMNDYYFSVYLPPGLRFYVPPYVSTCN